MLLLSNAQSQGLLKRIGKKAEQMVNEKLDKRTSTTLDSTTDRGLRKTYDKAIDRQLDSAFSATSKKEKNTKSQNELGDHVNNPKTIPITVANDSTMAKSGFTNSYGLIDFPATEKEAIIILSSVIWELQLKTPVYFIFKQNGELQGCASMDPLLCMDPGKWVLDWDNKIITQCFNNTKGTVRSLLKLTQEEFMTYDYENKAEVKYKAYKKADTKN
jgi:hypothetical protein